MIGIGKVAAKDWSASQFGLCDFGDKRRTDRLVRVGESMLLKSDSSMPKQMEDWCDLKAAYRLFSMPQVTHESISRPHWTSVCSMVRAPNLGLVLFVQDDSELDFTSHRRGTPDLGFIGSGTTYGMMIHSTLCVIPGVDAQVVGLADQKVWTRALAPGKNKPDAYWRKRRTEHDLWEETVVSIGPAPDASAGTRWVSVGDRASDVFSYISHAVELNWECLVRSKFNRVLSSEGEDQQDPEVRKLHDRMRSLVPAAQTQITLRARPTVKARVVELNIAWTTIVLPRPHRKGGTGPVAMNCVRVWEDAPKDQKPEPLEWILLTTLPVQDAEQAIQVVEFYRHRWLIEEYHKCLKTGCKFESRQVSTKHRLEAVLGLLSIVAVYLLQFKAPLQSRPTSKDIVKALQAIKQTDQDLTDPKQFWRRVAMLGGFLGRKGDGDPGWQTIWAGWNRLQDILFGMELAQGMKCG